MRTLRIVSRLAVAGVAAFAFLESAGGCGSGKPSLQAGPDAGSGGGQNSVGSTGGSGAGSTSGSTTGQSSGTSSGHGASGSTSGSASSASGSSSGGSTSGQGASGSSAGTSSAASAADAGSTCPGTLAAGDNNESITSGGESRTFIVHVPTGYTGSSPVPVVFDFHPLGGTGSEQEGSSGWKAQCDSVGCIAVYPDSSSKAGDDSWNAGYCCDNAEADQIDDVQFTRDMITWLEGHTCVDPKRIYASGGSNGGGMSYRLACQAADVIAAVAPVDFRCVTGTDPLANAAEVTATDNTACVCTLPRPIAVIAYDEGEDNTVVPYNGGQTPNFKTDCAPNASCVGIGFTSAEVNVETWADFDKCTGSATTNPNNSICQTWASCSGNTTVTLCTDPESEHLAAYSNPSAKVAATAWDVFETQSLP